MQVGGAQRLLSDMLPMLARNDDIDISLAIYADPGNSPMYVPIRSNPRIRVRILNLPAGRNASLNPFVRIRAIQLLRALMKDADVCHVHLFPALYDAVFASSGLPVRLVFTNHSTSNRRRNLSRLAAIERKIYSRYNSIACISPAAARSLSDWLRISPTDERIHVVLNGINPDLFTFTQPGDYSKPPNRKQRLETIPLPSDPSELIAMYDEGVDADRARRMRRAGIRRPADVFGRDGHAIVMISRFVESKDHESLLKALALIKSNPEAYPGVPDDIFIAFAGSGEKLHEIMNLALSLKVDNDVVFLGDRSDIPRLIAAASIGAQISHWEGFGLTACEILAGEAPLIASDIPGMGSLVKGGARLVKHADPASIAAAVADILAPASPEIFNDTLLMQAEGVKIARRRHLRHTLRQYLELYNA